ncbi:hypothetical protein [Cyclobacterium marinum]|uniref:hypothetical protein n=1 Tax=Cyclobacterium marinum TaxID=104 RepID=UPI0011EF126F|nr:hypothetical protein [Cyclobacterium marinum]MBI0399300.1 hypothetical protein [Cyclobacterium marinum]
MTDFSEKILIGFITLVLGVIVKHFWDKIVNRVSKLQYSIWHNYVGSSIEDLKFGSVKLLYNDNELKNLYASNVHLLNSSGKDLDDIELNITCDQNSLIMVSHGQRNRSLNELEFTDKYLKELQSVNKDNQAYVYSRRDYKIPVLNRGDSISITLLTTNFVGEMPFLNVGTDHKGVNLKYFTEQQKLFGVSQAKSVIIGILISIVLCYPIFQYFESKPILISVALLNGWIASIYGILALKLSKWLRNLFE